jgi:hypothetical protein
MQSASVVVRFVKGEVYVTRTSTSAYAASAALAELPSAACHATTGCRTMDHPVLLSLVSDRASAKVTASRLAAP